MNARRSALVLILTLLAVVGAAEGRSGLGIDERWISPDAGPAQVLPVSLSGTPVPREPWPQAIHTFGFRGPEFVLDNQPFLMLAGEMHFQRIPRE